jgi:hypothetical protein
VHAPISPAPLHELAAVAPRPAWSELASAVRTATGDGAGEERWPAGRGRRRGRHGGRPRQCSRKETLLFPFFIFTIFNLPDKWAICPHQQAYFFFAMSALHVGPYLPDNRSWPAPPSCPPRQARPGAVRSSSGLVGGRVLRRRYGKSARVLCCSLPWRRGNEDDDACVLLGVECGLIHVLFCARTTLVFSTTRGRFTRLCLQLKSKNNIIK